MKAFKWGYLVLILLFLYAPILFMIALSFNGGESRAVWGGYDPTYAESGKQEAYQAMLLGQELPLQIPEDGQDDQDAAAVMNAINAAFEKTKKVRKNATYTGEAAVDTRVLQASIQLSDGQLSTLKLKEKSAENERFSESALQSAYQELYAGAPLPLAVPEDASAETRLVAQAVNAAFETSKKSYTGEAEGNGKMIQVSIRAEDGRLAALTVGEAPWRLLSFRWYIDLFRHSEIQNALVVTLEVAVLATVISTIIGTLAAIGVYAMRARPQSILMALNNIPLTMPDIVTGISLMLLFIFSGVARNRWTMLLAHITFDVPYVILSVLPKLRQMNPNTYEAALDLGSTPMHALFHVILPIIMPGVLTGAMLAFTLSLDDFTISYFTSPTDQNLATLIYSQSRQGVKLYMYALSTLMFVILLVLLLLVNKRSDSAIKE